MLSDPADEYEIEYHLTPFGWKRGREWFLGTMQADTPAPADRVLTLKKRLYQPSASVRKDISWSVVWRDPKVEETDIESLRGRYRLPEA